MGRRRRCRRNSQICWGSVGPLWMRRPSGLGSGHGQWAGHGSVAFADFFYLEPGLIMGIVGTRLPQHGRCPPYAPQPTVFRITRYGSEHAARHGRRARSCTCVPDACRYWQRRVRGPGATGRARTAYETVQTEQAGGGAPSGADADGKEEADAEEGNTEGGILTYDTSHG